MAASLSLSQARRVALKAQGLAGARPAQPVSARAVGRTFAQLQLVQIDSVNIVSRSHFLPFFSRLGTYDRAILSTMAGTAPRKMMEYWAHEASFIRPEHFQDLVLWQNRKWVGSSGMDPALRESLEQKTLQLLAHSRALTAREVKDQIDHQHSREQNRDDWGWNWTDEKRTLEGMFERGIVAAASRNEQFERRYSLVEKVLPPALRAPTDSSASVASGTPNAKKSAMNRLIEAAARAHGIGTVRCFADYFRLPSRDAAQAVEYLVAGGVLKPVVVEGWNAEIFMHTQATIPRRALGRALLSPFDSLVFERRRLQALFDFHYRLEIYTPENKRVYGYYVLPFLLGEKLVARVDVKADRKNSVLLVKGAFAEPDAPTQTATELASELALMASWLGLSEVVVSHNGDLAAALKRASQDM